MTLNFKTILAISLILYFQSVFAQISDIADSNKRDYDNLKRTRFSLLPHNNNFLLPYVYNWMPNESIYSALKALNTRKEKPDYYKNQEAEFQLSFAIPVITKLADRDWDILFAYTHHAWWQVYNSEWSRAFRETNYMPEFFSRYVYSEPKKILGIKLVALDSGYIHQSNGQIEILSRSWDRLFARAIMTTRNFTFVVMGWYRIPERKDDDENRDITDYMGLGSLEIARNFGKHTLHFKTPLFSRHLSVDLKYSFPFQEGLRWYASYESGYGHSMIEYNKPTQRFGIGVTLESLFDKKSN